MATNAKIFRINYKSDFILTLTSDAGWMTPFCIKFWTGAPSQAYYVGWDGETYTHCAPVEGEPTKLQVQFDDHHLPIGDLMFQVAYHFTVADFPNDTEDEVLNQANITVELDGEPAKVMLDFTGETAPEIQFSLPAYANEVQRIANEQQRIANEQTRIQNEEARIAAEATRQQNEAQRIRQEEARVSEFAQLKLQSQDATSAANTAAALANEKAALAADKAALAGAAATLANAKAQLAADKAALAASAAQLANDKAALAQQKAEYARQQGDYAKAQGDTALADHRRAESDHATAADDHTRAESDHGIAADDHTQAGNDHTRAESDHSTAASDHTRAGNDHTTAQSDHGIAADDHTQAGNDHTRAESDHGIAADDHTQAGNDHTRAESDHTRAEQDHTDVQNAIEAADLVYDISKANAVGGVLATYADLSAALGVDGANVPVNRRQGGMTVKFVLTSDNKYVQYRLMSETFNTTPANWQGVDEQPTTGSDNLVKSGGVMSMIDYTSQYKNAEVKQAADDNDFAISDGDGYEIAAFKNGHVKTQHFESEEAPQGKYDDSNDVLNISDEEGNVILELDSEGHIKTSAFYSRNINAHSNYEQMAIGELIQGYIGEYGIVSSNMALSSSSIAIPYPEVTIYIGIKRGYKVIAKGGYINGDNGTRFTTNLGTFTNGQSVTLPKNETGGNALEYLRFQVEKINGGNITPSEDTGLKITYKCTYNVIDCNSDILDEIQANSSLVNQKGLYPVIVHGSDIHGDYERLKNLYKVAESLDATAIVLTGDIVVHNHKDYINPVIELAESSQIPTLVCAGNHEVGFAYSSINLEINDAGVYDYVFSELAEHFNYLSSSGVVSSVPYYYKDIPSKNLRVISVYQYINGTQDAGEGLQSLRWFLHYNQAEIDWLCDTLASTPENYGIIMLIHTPELSQNGGKIQDNDLFFTDYNFGNVSSSVQNGQPLLEIIDAFIARTTLQKTYTQKGTPSSFEVDADFSNVSESIKFISQMSGHYHRDAVGLVNGATQRQVSLNISCTAGNYYQSHGCDTVRNIKNNTGDSFNVYVINQTSKKIDIYKIGAHRTVDNRNRVHMDIQYEL